MAHTAECEDCGKEFDFNGDEGREVETDRGIVILCGSCFERTQRASQLPKPPEAADGGERMNLRASSRYGTPLHCTHCGEDFGSRTAFARHRVRTVQSDHSSPYRCLTAEEMEKHAGMEQTFAGLWRIQ